MVVMFNLTLVIEYYNFQNMSLILEVGQLPDTFLLFLYLTW